VIPAEIRSVREARLAGDTISAQALDGAVERVEALLGTHDPVAEPEVKAAVMEVLLAIDYARDKYQFERTRSYNRRQFSYPGVPHDGTHAQPANVLAPTALGNIGRTMQSYALSRYGMDLDVLWSRLQHVVQKDEKHYPVLQAVKAQLDCCVVLAWLTAAFTVIWVVTLWWVGRDVSPFVLVTVGGSLLSVAWYRLACERYRVFADLVRTAVDVFRFDLLRSLALPLPAGPDEERTLWERLSGRTGYELPMDVTYRHPAGK
jgi:hypothetical protein